MKHSLYTKLYTKLLQFVLLLCPQDYSIAIILGNRIYKTISVPSATFTVIRDNHYEPVEGYETVEEAAQRLREGRLLDEPTVHQHPSE